MNVVLGILIFVVIGILLFRVAGYIGKRFFNTSEILNKFESYKKSLTILIVILIVVLIIIYLFFM